MKSSNRIAAALALGLAAHAAGAQELCPVSDPGESEWMLVPSELFDSIVITADHAELYRDGRATHALRAPNFLFPIAAFAALPRRCAAALKKR